MGRTQPKTFNGLYQKPGNRAVQAMPASLWYKAAARQALHKAAIRQHSTPATANDKHWTPQRWRPLQHNNLELARSWHTLLSIVASCQRTKYGGARTQCHSADTSPSTLQCLVHAHPQVTTPRPLPVLLEVWQGDNRPHSPHRLIKNCPMVGWHQAIWSLRKAGTTARTLAVLNMADTTDCH